jgi:hypothetical protein
MRKRHLYDVDDLWDAGQITKYLVPLRRANPEFRVTAFAIPAKLGEVHLLKKAFPWITFAIHGWDHPQFECVAWTKEQGEKYIRRALDMGYDKLFKPPNWRYDDELVEAIRETGVVFARHKKDTNRYEGVTSWHPTQRYDYTWAHTHIQPSPATDNINTHELFGPRYVETVTQFVTPLEVIHD